MSRQFNASNKSAFDTRMRGHVVLLAAHDHEVRQWLAPALAMRGIECRTVEQAAHLDAVDGAGDHSVVVIADGDESGADAPEIARRIRGGVSAPSVVMLNRASNEERAIRALRAGVCDYFVLPIDRDEVVPRIERLVAQSAPGARVTSAGESADALVTESAIMRTIVAQASRVAATDAPVLLTGETGSGKERLAQLLHARGHRHRHSFVAVNCGALPEGLVESELFGFERGAFTGATGSYEGKFGLARGGTLFLDEIGEMSLASQAKVLRALDSGEMYRLGGRRPVPFDARIIAATNRDVEGMVAAGTFRQDLYYRLNVVRIRMPPLRERPEDIPKLALRCAREFARRYHRRIEGIDAQAIEALQRYGWPGNIRELRNVVESACIACDGLLLVAANLPTLLRERGGGERERVLEALQATRWNKSRAADRLNWSRMTLYRKLAKYRLDPAAS
jgi:DNA-binding NtrC family response regulator